jgi:hypothetical protein
MSGPEIDERTGKPKKQPFKKETVLESLKVVAEKLSDDQLSPEVRSRLQSFLAVPHTDREFFLFLDSIAKLPITEISGFVQVLCDVRRFYLEP